MKKNRVITKYFPKIKKGISSLIKFIVYDKFHINSINAIEVYNIHKVFQLKSYKNNSILDLLKSIFVNQNDYSKEVLSKIEFQVPKNSTLGIIGKNGSGKSTLLRLLANITSPSEGYILTKGKLAAIIDIGSGFHPELTGRENIRFYGKMIGMSEAKIKELTQTIIDFSELIDYIDQPIKFYSNGMYLRLAFSIVVHSDVDIILFDEVLTVGDNSFNIKCFQKINELKKNTTIVLISHNMDDILRVCDQCIWIDNGSIKHFGHPSKVVKLYVENDFEKQNYHGIKKNQYDYKFNRNFDPIELNRIQLIGLGTNQSVEGLDYNENFEIKIDLNINDSISEKLIPTLLISDQYNNNIISSATIFNKDNQLIIKDRGLFILKCIFPKQLLNVGFYKISFLMYDENDITKFYKSNIAIFRIVSNNQIQNEYLVKSSFSIAAALDWKITQKKSNSEITQ